MKGDSLQTWWAQTASPVLRGPWVMEGPGKGSGGLWRCGLALVSYSILLATLCWCCSQVSYQEAVTFLKEIFTAQMIMFSLNSHLSYFFNENLLQFSNLGLVLRSEKGRMYSLSGYICCGWSFCRCPSYGFLLRVFYFWTLKIVLGESNFQHFKEI